MNKQHRQWQFLDGLGEPNSSQITKQDILSAINFDRNGTYLSVGDKGGRVIIFERIVDKEAGTTDFEYFTEFQSHERKIDFLKSVEVPE